MMTNRKLTLADLYPQIAAEWDAIHNGELTPDKVAPHSNKSVWWRCNICGKEWRALISNRTKNKSGCPKCMKHAKTSFPEQALLYYIKQVFPDAVNSFTEFFTPKNTELDIYIPSEKIAIEYDGKAWHADKRSRKKAEEKFLKCEEKQARLIRVSEVEDQDLSFCHDYVYRDRLTPEGLDIAIRQTISLLTDEKVSVDTERDRNSILKQYISNLREQSIAYKFPEAVAEWDFKKNKGITPDMVRTTTPQKYWWVCKKGHEYQASPAHKFGIGTGCPVCSNRQVLPGYNDLETRYPDIAKEWDNERNAPIRASEVSPGAQKKYWWICDKNHSYQATPNDRTANHSNCPICSGHQVKQGYNDLVTTNPETAKKWDYEKNGILTPFVVTKGSTRAVWWKCTEGHSWKKEVRAQVLYDSCPVCSGRLLVPEVNDLATTHPQLADEWHPQKNGELMPNQLTRTSPQMVWWKCLECGTEWEAKINQRVLHKTGCPQCGYSKKMQRTRAENIRYTKKDLVSTFPEIASEWDYEHNIGLDPNMLLPGSNRKVWWICKNQHHYQAWMSDRTGARKTGCPYCSGKRKLDTEGNR